MSLDKAIKYGKEKRKPYRGIQAFDGTTRNHGCDDHALSNRIYKSKKQSISGRQQEQDDFNSNDKFRL